MMVRCARAPRPPAVWVSRVSLPAPPAGCPVSHVVSAEGLRLGRAWLGAEEAMAAGRGQRELQLPPQKEGTTSDQILQTGTVLLKCFIRDQVQCCGDNERITATMSELKDLEPQAYDAKTRKLSDCLRRIADELNGNTELQNMMDQVQAYPPKEVFFKVATDMFSDGTVNWGRVVALFYFACRLVLKAVCAKVPELIRTVIGWTMEYIREYVLSWIQAHGGWEGLLSYFGTPTWQTIAVFSAGVLTASLTFWKMS